MRRFFLLFLTYTFPLLAQDPVIIEIETPEFSRKAYFVDQALLAHGTMGDRFALETLNQLSLDPDFDLKKGYEIANYARTAWNSLYGPEGRRQDREALAGEVQTFMEGVKNLAEVDLKGAAENGLKVLWDHHARESRKMEFEFLAGDVQFSGYKLQASSQLQGWSVAAAVQRSETDEEYRKAFDALFQKSMKGLGIRESEANWARQFPEAANFLQGKNIKEAVEELRKQKGKGLSQEQKAQYENILKTALDEQRAKFKEAIQDRKEKGPQDPTTLSPQDRARLENEIAERWSKYSAFVNFVDRVGGKEVAFYTRSTRGAIEIGQLFDRFTSNLISTPDFLIGGLGIVTNLIGTFKTLLNPQPSDTQLILEAIGKLREAVHQLRVELHQLGAELKQQLAQVESNLTYRINAMEHYLRADQKELRELLVNHAISLGATREQISALRESVLSSFSEASLQRIRPFHVRTEWNEIDYVDYKKTMDELALCAEQSSADGMFNGSPTSIPEKAGAVERLAKLHEAFTTTSDFWNRIGAIGNYYESFGLRGVSKRLPNPKLWSICTTAYLKLARKWPALFARAKEREAGSLGQLAGILDKGNELRSFLNQLQANVGEPTSILNEPFAVHEQIVNGIASEFSDTTTAFFTKHRFGDVALYADQSVEKLRAAFIVNRSVSDRQSTISPCESFQIGRLPSGRALTPVDIKTFEKRRDEFKKIVLKVNKDQTAIIASWIPTSFLALEQLGAGNLTICFDEFGWSNVGEVSNKSKDIPEQVRKNFDLALQSFHAVYFNRPYTRFRVQFELLPTFLREFNKRAVQVDILAATSSDYYLSSGNLLQAWKGDREEPTAIDQILVNTFLGSHHNPASYLKGEAGKWADAVLADELAARRKELEAQVKGQVNAPAGKISELFLALDANKIAMEDYLRLLIGDDYLAEHYTHMREALSALPGTRFIQDQIVAKPNAFVDVRLRKEGLDSFLAPYGKLKETLKALSDRNLLPGSGRHALLESVMEEGETYFLQTARNSERVTYPRYFPSRRRE